MYKYIFLLDIVWRYDVGKYYTSFTLLFHHVHLIITIVCVCILCVGAHKRCLLLAHFSTRRMQENIVVFTMCRVENKLFLNMYCVPFIMHLYFVGNKFSSIKNM